MPDWCVDTALRLSALGVAVVPVDPEEKKPLIKGFSKWRGPPTRKPITQWWSNFPDAGLGILTGAISGLTVVDIDDATLIGEAIDTYGDTPLQTATPSGGRHLYFGHRNEGNKVRVGGHKIDIRGQGGLVLAPPTMRAGRRFYSFVKGHWDCIPELPAIPRAQSARLGITLRGVARPAPPVISPASMSSVSPFELLPFSNHASLQAGCAILPLRPIAF